MPVTGPPRNVSAVVLCFNSANYIQGCVESLCAAFDELPGTHEIWVVDNGSTDQSPRILRNLELRHARYLRVIYNPENLGTTRSRNSAILRSSGNFVLILDSDATATSDTIGVLLDLLTNDESIGIAVPRLEYPDGRFQLSTDSFPTFWRKLERLFRLREIEARGATPGSNVDVDYAISAFWLVRRKLFDEIGLLDENIFYSPEDVDFCVRTWLAGHRIVMVPAVSATHDAQEISRSANLSGFMLRHAKGLFYYFIKHRYCFSRRGLYKRIARGLDRRNVSR